MASSPSLTGGGVAKVRTQVFVSNVPKRMPVFELREQLRSQTAGLMRVVALGPTTVAPSMGTALGVDDDAKTSTPKERNGGYALALYDSYENALQAAQTAIVMSSDLDTFGVPVELRLRVVDPGTGRKAESTYQDIIQVDGIGDVKKSDLCVTKGLQMLLSTVTGYEMNVSSSGAAAASSSNAYRPAPRGGVIARLCRLSAAGKDCPAGVTCRFLHWRKSQMTKRPDVAALTALKRQRSDDNPTDPARRSDLAEDAVWQEDPPTSSSIMPAATTVSDMAASDVDARSVSSVTHRTEDRAERRCDVGFFCPNAAPRGLGVCCLLPPSLQLSTMWLPSSEPSDAAAGGYCVPSASMDTPGSRGGGDGPCASASRPIRRILVPLSLRSARSILAEPLDVRDAVDDADSIESYAAMTACEDGEGHDDDAVEDTDDDFDADRCQLIARIEDAMQRLRSAIGGDAASGTSPSPPGLFFVRLSVEHGAPTDAPFVTRERFAEMKRRCALPSQGINTPADRDAFCHRVIAATNVLMAVSDGTDAVNLLSDSPKIRGVLRRWLTQQRTNATSPSADSATGAPGRLGGDPQHPPPLALVVEWWLHLPTPLHDASIVIHAKEVYSNSVHSATRDEAGGGDAGWQLKRVEPLEEGSRSLVYAFQRHADVVTNLWNASGETSLAQLGLRTPAEKVAVTLVPCRVQSIGLQLLSQQTQRLRLVCASWATAVTSEKENRAGHLLNDDNDDTTRQTRSRRYVVNVLLPNVWAPPRRPDDARILQDEPRGDGGNFRDDPEEEQSLMADPALWPLGARDAKVLSHLRFTQRLFAHHGAEHHNPDASIGSIVPFTRTTHAVVQALEREGGGDALTNFVPRGVLPVPLQSHSGSGESGLGAVSAGADSAAMATHVPVYWRQRRSVPTALLPDSWQTLLRAVKH